MLRRNGPVIKSVKHEIMGWQRHQLDHALTNPNPVTEIISTSLQTDNHASTSSLNYV